MDDPFFELNCWVFFVTIISEELEKVYKVV
jgi:hypothetical protein